MQWLTTGKGGKLTLDYHYLPKTLAMKRIITISVMTAVVIGLLTFIVNDLSAQRTVRIDGESIGAFPIVGKGMQIELSPGLTFSVSSTTSISCVTRPTLEWLRFRGYVTDSTTRFFISRDALGKLEVTSLIYKVNLPISRYEFRYDSITGRTMYKNVSSQSGLLEGLEVTVAETENNNVLGMDFMRRFIVEYNHADQSMTFHLNVPDNYELLGNISVGHRPSDVIGCSPRYYMDMKVDHESYSFLINTDMQDITVKVPAKETGNPTINRPLNEQVIDTDGCTVPVIVDQSAWVEFGNRAGSRRTYYFPYGSKPEVNPFIFFNQDLVIDFNSRNIYLRPYYHINELTS